MENGKSSMEKSPQIFAKIKYQKKVLNLFAVFLEQVKTIILKYF